MFIKGGDIKETLDIGAIAILKERAPNIIKKYIFQFPSEELAKKLEEEIEDACGFEVEVKAHLDSDDEMVNFLVSIKNYSDNIEIPLNIKNLEF